MLNINISIKIAEVSQEILLKRNKDHHLMFFSGKNLFIMDYRLGRAARRVTNKIYGKKKNSAVPKERTLSEQLLSRFASLEKRKLSGKYLQKERNFDCSRDNFNT